MEINNHKPKIPDTINPINPKIGTPWKVGPVLALTINEEPIIIHPTIKENATLFTILFKSVSGLSKTFLSSL